MQIKNLTMTYGKQVIFENINLVIPNDTKVGVVGVNGAGKTTFFKIIMGLLTPDFGKVILKNGTKIDWLPQVIGDEGTDLNTNVFEYLLSGRPIEELNQKLEKLYIELSTASEEKHKTIYNEITKIQNELEYYDIYNAENTLLKIIEGTGITDEILNHKLCELSGGQKSKVAFVRLLYSKPDIILLDEPTNHLDDTSRKYITNYLKNYHGSVYIISHDIKFLDEVTNTTLHLDKMNKTFELYKGNYTNFQKLKQIREENLERQREIQEKEEKKLRDIVLLYSNSSGKRKRMAQDREKKLEKLRKEKVKIVAPPKNVKFNIEVNRESEAIPLEIKNLCFSYNKESTHDLIEDLSFNIYRGEKFLIVGENGVGKSTLLKLIVKELTPDSGEIYLSNKTDIGYYAQELDGLDMEKTIIENFKELNLNEKKLRNVLGRFLFFGDEVFKRIGVLSPGERARVALAKLSISGANFLVLDEPTNHLDPETAKIIADVFKEFSGTMIVVSHNPDFTNHLGIERTIILPEGILSYYNEGIIEYYQKLNERK